MRLATQLAFNMTVLLTIALIGSLVFADEDDKAAEERLAFMKESVSSVELMVGGDESSRLQLRPEPIQRWNNLVSSVKDGTVFIWTLNGRPEVAAQVFLVPGNTWLQEFQSLSEERLTGLHGGRRFWTPKPPGVEMKRYAGPGRPRPSPSEAGRRAQMRSIGRQFKAKDLFEDKEPYDLRFLPKPLYEYEDETRGIMHGALFAFVHGTDPEVLLLIEAHQNAEGLIWEIGFAPLTSYECKVSRNDEVYWTCPKRPPPNQQADTFLLHVYKAARE